MSNSKKKKPARGPFFRRLLTFTVVLTLLVAGGNALLHLNYFRVQSIEISGNTHESAGELISVTGLDQNPPMISVNSQEVTNLARSLRWVESIRVACHWPHRLTLIVVERQPVAVAADPTGALFLVDVHGVQLDPPSVGVNLPRLEARGSSAPWAYRSWARPAARVAARLPLAFSRQVAVVQISRRGEIRLKMTTPVTFVLGGESNLREKFVAVASVIAHQTLRRGAIVDVSVPSAVTIQ
jgi:cell division protein FtsQ